MNQIKQNRLLTLEEESPYINPTKRCGGNCIEGKLGKLSSPIVPGVSGFSRKRSFPWEENSTENLPAKRARKQIPKRKFKISREPEVPNDFLVGLPVLLDTDPSDWEEGSPKSEIQVAKSTTEDSRNLLTYQQLKLICCEMMEQCDNRVVQEYEVALTQKMAEQYDTFIKFKHDQLQRECEHEASYLS
ncbi:akirin [Drosophila teissieri]|uniref:akirin n=1 Tax=Drosophila teissieri TaxID=7243 RepID=UPI001CBA0D2B|nr:akirin [Drosophila teissieri]